MKRIMSFIMAIVMCLLLCACNQSTDTPETSHTTNGMNDELNNDNSGNDNTDTDWIVRKGYINVAKLRESLDIVELTTENWRDYFKVYHYSYSYDEEKIVYDDFGEVISSETITHSGEGDAFGAGNEWYHWYDQVAIELKDKATGELSVYKFDVNNPNDMHLDEEFNLDNYECTRIKGSIYYLDIPVGTLPINTYLWPDPEDAGPEAIVVSPGTNAIVNSCFLGWID